MTLTLMYHDRAKSRSCRGFKRLKTPDCSVQTAFGPLGPGTQREQKSHHDLYEKKRGRGTLQRYLKTEASLLLCIDCVPCPRVQKNISLEECAQKCSKAKMKNDFTCRAFYFDHQTRKCHLLAFDHHNQVVRLENKENHDLYEKKEYVRECIIGNGENYRGRKSITKSGIRCQPWAASIPHEHNFQRHSKKKDLRENFCRNPEGEATGPWCFTSDPAIRYQECDLPQCSEVECMICKGEGYRGPMDHTSSGRECQRWDTQWPHKHAFQPSRHPDKGLTDNNCRNPSNDMQPWCYTMDPDKRWEYCNISVCDYHNDTTLDTTTSCYWGQGENYRGNMNMTSLGIPCQHWNMQLPHKHNYTSQNYKCKDLRENFCRNPDGDENPWCFTTDAAVRRALCTNIPRCEFDKSDSTDCYEGSGETYRGNLAKTRSGIPCGYWADHDYSDGIRSAAGLVLNLCRNPDGDKHGPWCYTTNYSIPWDYCQLQHCKTLSTKVLSNLNMPKPACFIHKTTRIVGGTNVQRDGSWVVSIQKSSAHWCGGSLIREEWVLTDQQCFSSCVPDLSEYSVLVGLLHLNLSSQRPLLRIAHVICGPEGSNLALLKLSHPAPLSEMVRTIQLPVAGCEMKEGSYCHMYGWGETKGTGYKGHLKMVSLPIIGTKRCSAIHNVSLPITEAKLCAGGEKDKGVCEKDYGGPLVCQERESKVIMGVSIHGRGCGIAQRPAIFVNVPFYADWIRKVFIRFSEDRNY
ncbi:hepatocyte growth factor a isoform X1 [Alosa alosa]|uniref:hepatocyte growth factor a isoform X1 n=1 Tax=Alosa alosa TaxID=278164 RepID=UPI00201539F6|nr:hepatocyte growth factor a isoform X1 [Alosa alosa]